MAEEPMPASQAKTIERTGPVSSGRPAPAHPPARAPAEAIDFLPFIASMSAVAAAEVTLVVDLSAQQDGGDEEGRRSAEDPPRA
jgi:hypothetical protein